MDAMLMIRPAFRSMKYGATDLHVRNTDLVLTAKARSQSSSVLFVNGMPGGAAMPALLTRMSMRPSVSRVRSTIDLTSALLVTSVFMASTLRPSAFTSSATFSAFSTWMSGIAMSAPSLAMARTIPRPMPLPPPVTTATFPASRIAVSSCRYNRALEGTHDITRTQKPQLVRPQGSRRLQSPRVDEGGGVQRPRLRRPARRRHLQFVVGAHQLQLPPASGGGSGEARRVERGRLSAGVPRDLARRGPHEAHHDALPKFDGDGRGGVHPRLSARRRRAPLRLRQDDACHAHGGGLGGHPLHHGDGRPHAPRQLAHGRARLRHRRLAPVGGVARGPDHRRGLLRGGVLHVALERSLHGDGHRLHDGLDGGGARYDAARQRRHSRRGLAPARAGGDGGPP